MRFFLASDRIIIVRKLVKKCQSLNFRILNSSGNIALSFLFKFNTFFSIHLLFCEWPIILHVINSYFYYLITYLIKSSVRTIRMVCKYKKKCFLFDFNNIIYFILCTIITKCGIRLCFCERVINCYYNIFVTRREWYHGESYFKPL